MEQTVGHTIDSNARARYRQVAASYYYGEIVERGAAHVIKEMARILNLYHLRFEYSG